MDLIKIQQELKAPKGQLNKFGNYKYRSAEDILEAVKPLLVKYDCLLTLSDEIVSIGERYYIKATATLKTKENSISVTAFAREAETKKGMDESQITGMASSYARKYALNGLFCIDDTKDADTMDNTPELNKVEDKAIELVRAVDNLEDLEVIWKEYEEANSGKLRKAVIEKGKEFKK